MAAGVEVDLTATAGACFEGDDVVISGTLLRGFRRGLAFPKEGSFVRSCNAATLLRGLDGRGCWTSRTMAGALKYGTVFEDRVSRGLNAPLSRWVALGM